MNSKPTPANADRMTWDELCKAIAAKDARIAELERERDAAVADMKTIVDTATECLACKHRVGPSGCPRRYNDCQFEWRGLQGEKGEPHADEK